MSEASRFDRMAVPLVLVAMAVSRPLLDLLGQNAEFFLARRAPVIDIVAVGLLLGLGLPLLAGALGMLPGRFGRLVLLTLTVVLSVLLLRLALGLTPLTGWARDLTAVGGGALVAFLFERYEWPRLMARYLAPVPLVFTALFFFATPTGAAMFDSENDLGAAASVGNPVPLVWLVLDEFPAASLMAADGSILAERFPNFARLAADGVWFPNAVTVQQQTEHSVPAMLTGTQPSADLTPFAGQYPNNAFTLLAASHTLDVEEAVTHLCPSSLCVADVTPESMTSRARTLAVDLAVVAGHTFLPEAWSDALPPIDQGWGYFGRDLSEFDPVAEFWEAVGSDPRDALERTEIRVAGEPGDRPPFVFTHAMVPHHPWILLPSGQRYPLSDGRSPGTTRTGWGTDSWLIGQGLQRHLLTVGYADHALGRILDAIEAAGWYEEAMIVVVADHGIAIREGVEHQRVVTDETIGEIAAVPLLIKAPGVEGGVIDRRRALTVDIVPTIADVMDIDLAWPVDGSSLFGPPANRESTTTRGPQGSVIYGVDGQEVLTVARRLAETFPDPDLYALRPAGSPDLLGSPVDPSTLPASEVRVFLDQRGWYANIDPEADQVPARITARLTGPVDGGETVVVVVNGTVAAVTRSYVEDGRTRIQAMVPPEAFLDGANRIEFAIWADGALWATAGP